MLKPRFIIFVALFFAPMCFASPWIGTNDRQLHYDLQTLVEWGYLEAAVTSYPVPWKGINSQLSQLDSSDMPAPAAVAADRLRYYFQLYHSQKISRFINMYGASEAARFAEFDGKQGAKARFNVATEAYLGSWAVKFSANSQPGGEVNLDQSYLAYQFGGWNLRLGAIDQWWGPGHSSSLIMSNNARPIPALALSRSMATRSEHPWLSLLGPWFFTAQMGVLESKRVVENVRIWSTRFNFMPLKRLEIGASWSAMWGGEGQGNSLGDFWDVISLSPECADGAADCDSELNTKKGNHLAGFDIKYSFDLFNHPLSIYAQRVGEDAADSFNITDQADLFGLSTYIFSSKVYLEGSDTNVSCGGDDSTITNCYYEHGTYKSGYRRYGRAIGSAFDSDAKMVTLGLNHHFTAGDVLELNLRYLDLNPDKTSPSPVLTEGNSEKLWQLTGFYQTSYRNWLLKLGASIDRSEVDGQDAELDGLIYTEIKYSLP